MKEGWKYVKLGEIAVIKGGKRVPKGKALSTIPTAHKYIRVADFNDNGSVDMDDIHYVSDDVYEQIKRYTITSDDVYVSIAGTIGKTGIIPKELDGANLTENACKLQLSEVVDKRFVYYFTLSPTFKSQIAVSTKVSAQPKLALTRLAEVQISIPPLSEQQSIVAHLDASFAEIDALKAKAAEEVANAKAMFDAALREEITPKEGWEEKTLGELCDKITDGTHSSPPNTPTGDYMYVTAKNIKSYGLDLTGITYVTKEIHNEIYSRCNPELGDVLFIKDGATTGIAVLNTIKEEFSLLSSVALLKTKKDMLLSSYLCYSMNSPIFYDYVRSKMEGAAITRVTLKKIKDFSLWYPKNLEVQQRIVAKLDTLRSHLTELEQKYNLIAANCDALKQAILRETFE